VDLAHTRPTPSIRWTKPGLSHHAQVLAGWAWHTAQLSQLVPRTWNRNRTAASGILRVSFMCRRSECFTIAAAHQFGEGDDVAQRNQRGWLKKESRWLLSSPKRLTPGLKSNDCTSLLREVNLRLGITFGDLAQHYAQHELVDHTESIHAKHIPRCDPTNASSGPDCCRNGSPDRAFLRQKVLSLAC
jgi:hypothetical protein